MKIIKKDYNISTDNVEKRIVLLTDIHYYQPKDMKKLNKILDVLKNESFDYICLGGDIIDLGYIKDMDLFINWLKELSKLSKVFVSLGGHDFRGLKASIYYRNDEFYDKLSKINNLYVLDNDTYIEGNIRFIGLTLPYDYYYKYNENLNYFKRFVNNTFDTFKDKYNILLSHTPIPFTNLPSYDEIKLLKNIPLVLSGHTHAGIMPNFLRGVMKGRGIFSPHKQKMFPKDSYGLIKRGDTNIIISSGITKASHVNKFHNFDFIFDHEITFINLKKKN